MKQNLFWFVIVLFFVSCGEDGEAEFIGRQTEYLLSSANAAYHYEGTAVFKEMKAGGVEITVELSGERGDAAYYFPAHLHYGEYDRPEAPMAAMLSPVDIRTLKSVTTVEKLSSGETFRFDDLEDFDGHIKVHLADDGPDYHVILVAGNIGKNKATDALIMNKIPLCTPF